MVVLGVGSSLVCGTACVTLVLQAGIKRASPALEGRILNHQTSRVLPSGHVSLGSGGCDRVSEFPCSDSPGQFSGVPDKGTVRIPPC